MLHLPCVVCDTLIKATQGIAARNFTKNTAANLAPSLILLVRMKDLRTGLIRLGGTIHFVSKVAK